MLEKILSVWQNTYLRFLKIVFVRLFLKADERKFGYDAGYIQDEYGCNLSKCKCAPFDQTIIGKFIFLLTYRLFVSDRLLVTVFNRNLFSGDIAVSEKTLDKLMHISSDSNTAIWKAYADSTVALWDQNLVDGEYIIAFELNPGLGQSLLNLLPEVCNKWMFETSCFIRYESTFQL